MKRNEIKLCLTHFSRWLANTFERSNDLLNSGAIESRKIKSRPAGLLLRIIGGGGKGMRG